MFGTLALHINESCVVLKTDLRSSDVFLILVSIRSKALIYVLLLPFAAQVETEELKLRAGNAPSRGKRKTKFSFSINIRLLNVFNLINIEKFSLLYGLFYKAFWIKSLVEVSKVIWRRNLAKMFRYFYV